MIASSGILTASNMFNLGAGYDLMSILVAFTLDASTHATFAGLVSQVPLPAALPLLLSGLAIFGFASSRRRRYA